MAPNDEIHNLKNVLTTIKPFLSVKYLEEKSETPPGMISKWLRGKQSLPPKYVPEISKALKELCAEIGNL